MALNYNEYKKIQQECLILSQKKNADYGSDNLKRFGKQGIIIRMSDKMDRLITLMQRDALIKDESIEDTAKDMINYAAYLIMLSRGRLE